MLTIVKYIYLGDFPYSFSFELLTVFFLPFLIMMMATANTAVDIIMSIALTTNSTADAARGGLEQLASLLK